MKVNRLVGQTVALLTIGAVALAGCSRGGIRAVHGAAPTVSSAPTPASTPTTAPTPTAASTTAAPAPVHTGYDSARAQWVAGATAISANQGTYWSKAATDLTSGEATDTNSTGYAHEVDTLQNLISLPDAQQTPTQNAEYHADINDLNTFFNTPGLYS